MMKVVLAVGLALCLVGCDQGDQDNHTVKVQVAAHQVACTGITQQRCYQVRFADGAPWQLYYGEFKGFDYQPGFQYWLEVHQQHVAQQDNPEHSRLAWEVVKEISRTPVAATSTDTVGAAPSAVTGVASGSQPVTSTPTTTSPITTSPTTTGATPASDAVPATGAEDDIPPD